MYNFVLSSSVAYLAGFVFMLNHGCSMIWLYDNLYDGFLASIYKTKSLNSGVVVFIDSMNSLKAILSDDKIL